MSPRLRNFGGTFFGNHYSRVRGSYIGIMVGQALCILHIKRDVATINIKCQEPKEEPLPIIK